MDTVDDIEERHRYIVFVPGKSRLKNELSRRLGDQGAVVVKLDIDGTVGLSDRRQLGPELPERPGDVAVITDPLLCIGEETSEHPPDATTAKQDMLKLAESTIPWLQSRRGLLLLVNMVSTTTEIKDRLACSPWENAIRQLRQELYLRGIRLSQVHVEMKQSPQTVPVQLRVSALADILGWVILGRSRIDVSELSVTL